MSDKLLATIQRYKDKIAELEAENEKLKKCCSQRGARMQILKEFMDENIDYKSGATMYEMFCESNKYFRDWFDKDGVPK